MVVILRVVCGYLICGCYCGFVGGHSSSICLFVNSVVVFYSFICGCWLVCSLCLLLLWFTCGSLLFVTQGLLVWLVCSFKGLWGLVVIIVVDSFTVV